MALVRDYDFCAVARRPSPVGLHRVLEPLGVLPQAAWRLDPDPRVGDDEVRVRVERLNLDAASFRQLSDKHGGDGDAVRAEVLEIIRTRGKMHNPVTGSGGMLVGTVDEVGPASPLGLAPGDRIATLVSLTLTPLAVTDALARWDGRGEQVPCEGHAILFGRSVAAKLPHDLPAELALAVMDVCGAPALTARVVAPVRRRGAPTGRRGHRRRGQERLASPSPPPGARVPPAPSASSPSRPSGRLSRPPASRTPSPSPTPATRSRSPRP